jgi:hypothetical protein
MNTNQLKRLAKAARIRLIEDVSQRYHFWGFDEKGNAQRAPETMEGGYIFRGNAYTDERVPRKWQNLKSALKRHSPTDIIEEAAYTWFNRLLAIRILEKQGHIPPVLERSNGLHSDPLILRNAKRGQIPSMAESARFELMSHLTASEDDAALAILLSAYCRNNTLLNQVFGHIDDYTELLMPIRLTDKGSILSLLSDAAYISDDDFQQAELIGWLYQFYISDKKDEVFAGFKQKKKARAEDLPAATQIFTPKWIVRYLVENSAGKVWLDAHPDSSLSKKMAYLVKNEHEKMSEASIDDVTKLAIMDPAVGSGHFLATAFDLLMEMYQESGYTPRYAVEAILQHNLYGLDICPRAASLAAFAILLKAAAYYPDVLKNGQMPHIAAFPDAADFSPRQLYAFLGEGNESAFNELESALHTLKQGRNIGSALKLELSKASRTMIQKRFDHYNASSELDLQQKADWNKLKEYLQPLLWLTQRYPVVVANPPYMGGKNMNPQLSDYLKAYYPKTKSDLFAVFIEMMTDKLLKNGRLGTITMESWMFLSSYQKLREHLINNFTFRSLSHFGWHIIGIAFGTVAFILENRHPQKGDMGEYSYLTINDIDASESAPKVFPKKDNGRYRIMPQSNFTKIPGSPIAYWVSEKVVEIFTGKDFLHNYATINHGLSTGKNEAVVRVWFEINNKSFGTFYPSVEQAHKSKNKWFPYNKGGSFRKWYGNQEFVLRYDEYGIEQMRNFPGHRHDGKSNYFKIGITWSFISSSNFASRYTPPGFIFDVSGSSLFTNYTFEILGFLCSNLAYYFLKLLNPTLNFQVGNLKSLPLVPFIDTEEINLLPISNVILSKTDWDARETSWDFQGSPLISAYELRVSNDDIDSAVYAGKPRDTQSLADAYAAWEADVTAAFFHLHANEEELNRIFIEIYGLEDELTPDVPLADITILQEELDREALKRENKALLEKKSGLPIKQDLVMKQLISYAVGCFMGRYRLDKPGLHIAHPKPSAEELLPYPFNGQTFPIDEDGIIPLMGSESPFSDDLTLRLSHFIRLVWGEDHFTVNLNFINQALEMDLEKYITKHFWKDHVKTYKKKPIYWLFSSAKGAFQVLVYMHRMNRFTAQKIRHNYLFKQISWLEREIGNLSKSENALNLAESRRLDSLRQALQECRDYDLHLKNVADRQIEFDLDDGVTQNLKLFSAVVLEI